MSMTYHAAAIGEEIIDGLTGFLQEQQLKEAIKLLRTAWITLDYFEHNGDLSTRILSFLKQFDTHTRQKHENETL